MLFLTVALVLVGCAQAYIYWRQSELMEGQAKLTREAIDSGKESSEKQLRAYLTFSKFIVLPNESSFNKTYNVIFKNTGQTPAYRVVARGSISSLPSPQPRDFRMEPIPENLRSGTLFVGPQDPFTVRCFPGGHEPAVKSAALYVLGRVEYYDIFKKPRYTNFCFVLDDAGNHKSSPRGNDTDDYPDE